MTTDHTFEGFYDLPTASVWWTCWLTPQTLLMIYLLLFAKKKGLVDYDFSCPVTGPSRT